MKNLLVRPFLAVAILFLAFGFAPVTNYVVPTSPSDAILGDWMSVENNLKVHVFKENGQFKATIAWFDENGYKCKMNECTDEMNPDPALRSRKILGLQVLSGLEYDATENMWINGEIYDSNSGDTYDSVVKMPEKDKLYVRGYYLFEWLGKTLEFYRV